MNSVRACVALALMFVCPATARAHGDEDHGSAAAVTRAGQREHVAGAETELYIVVVKYPFHGAGGRLPVRVYVADATTGEPVAGANVRLEVDRVADVRVPAREPGVYTATIPEPGPGTHADAVVTVEGREVDVVTLNGLNFGAFGGAPSARNATSASGVPRRWIPTMRGVAREWTVAVFAVGALAVGAIVLRRRRLSNQRPAKGGRSE